MIFYFKKKTTFANFYFILFYCIYIWCTFINKDEILKKQEKIHHKSRILFEMLKKSKQIIAISNKNTRNISEIINAKKFLLFFNEIKKIKMVSKKEKKKTLKKEKENIGSKKEESYRTTTKINHENHKTIVLATIKMFKDSKFMKDLVAYFIKKRNQRIDLKEIVSKEVKNSIRTLRQKFYHTFIFVLLKTRFNKNIATEFPEIYPTVLYQLQKNLLMLKKLSNDTNATKQIIDALRIFCLTLYVLHIQFHSETQELSVLNDDFSLNKVSMMHAIYVINANEYNKAFHMLANHYILKKDLWDFSFFRSNEESLPIDNHPFECLCYYEMELIFCSFNKDVIRSWKTTGKNSEINIKKSLCSSIDNKFKDTVILLTEMNVNELFLKKLYDLKNEIGKLNEEYLNEIGVFKDEQEKNVFGVSKNKSNELICLTAIFKIMDLHFYNFLLLNSSEKFDLTPWIEEMKEFLKKNFNKIFQQN